MIKVRCWDGKKFGFINIDSNRISVPSQDWMPHLFSSDGVRFNEVVSFDLFTGLKDKNKVEIYEGDFLTSAFKGKSCVVSWDSSWRGHGWFLKIGTDFYNFYLAEKYEVIGNIHQNPEWRRSN